MSEGATITYLSSNSIIPHPNDKSGPELLYPLKYLNSLTFTGLPPHSLILKVNVAVILLRNINQMAGLCNGTRLLVTRLLQKVIEARIITGTATGHRVYIPRITFVHNENNLPFVFKRKQFLVKICYAMTINKSQGQSLHKLGVHLPNPVLSHGQLYVAFSHVTSPHALKVLIIPQEEDPPTQTKNIVFSTFLDGIHLLEVYT
ncbi:putative DNA helicase [Helianthus annuus]|nr:putative DNA helicase [Helianthus annuus]